MINSKQIRYLILTCLVVSLPIQPTGWFSSTKTKIGITALACAIMGCYIWHTVKKSKKQAQEREALRLVREQEKEALHRLLGNNVIIDENNPDFDTHVDRALFKALETRDEKNIELLMKWGGRVQLGFSYYSPEDNVSGCTGIPRAQASEVNAFLKYGEAGIKVYYDKDGVLTVAGSINKTLSDLLSYHHRIEQEHLDWALFKAVSQGRDREVKLLLEHNANVNVHRKKIGEPRMVYPLETPIFAAVRHKHPTTVKLLLEHGAHIDIIQKDYDGIEKDIYDFADGNEEIIQLLDEHRYKKHKDRKDNTAKVIYENPKEIDKFPTGVINIMAAYAAEYPLMEKRPLALEQEQEVPQTQEASVDEAAPQPHPLSLDAQAV